MGLLDQIFGAGGDDPRSQANMALAAGLLSGNLAGGLLGANQVFAEAPDRKLRRGLLEAQAENYKSEIEQRKAAMAKQQQIQDAVAGLLGGSKPAPAAPGQMGSGSFGVIPAPAGQPDIPQPRGGLSGASLEQIAGLHAIGGPNLMDAYKFARQGIERKPGSFYEDMQGRRTYVADPVKGVNFDGQRITTIPGFTDFTTAQTLAQEAPKALLGAAGRLNLRDNPDGTKSPVSELSENPTLQGVLSQLMGRPAPAASSAAPTVTRPASGMTPEQAAGRVETLQGEMRKAVQMASAATTPEERQRAQNDINALTRELRVAGARPSVTAAPGIGYGKTTAQATAEEAARTQAIDDAKAAAARDATMQKGAMNSRDTLNYIAEARKLFDKGPTNSGAGWLVDQGANLFGLSTPGADAAAQLETLSGWMVSNVPRMEGPQSNFDVQNYKTMAGMVGDSTKPLPQRKAALDTLEKLQAKYAHLNQPGNDAEPPKPKAFPTMPMPSAANAGKTLVDTQTGKRYKSNGAKWVEIQ